MALAPKFSKSGKRCPENWTAYTGWLLRCSSTPNMDRILGRRPLLLELSGQGFRIDRWAELGSTSTPRPRVTAVRTIHNTSTVLISATTWRFSGCRSSLHRGSAVFETRAGSVLFAALSCCRRSQRGGNLHKCFTGAGVGDASLETVISERSSPKESITGWE
jgi:hypothetical protein